MASPADLTHLEEMTDMTTTTTTTTTEHETTTTEETDMTTTTTTDARAWVGCLACYNNGHLTGAWFPALQAGDVTTQEVHDAGSGPRVDADGYVAHGWGESPHDELWVMDHEGLPVTGEMSPSLATEWAELLESVDEWQRDAFMAWVLSGDYSQGGDGLPCVTDFLEAYAGEWDTFRAYAESLADDIGMLADVPEEVSRYFDWNAWARDLSHDYRTVEAADAGVYVFRNA